MNASHTLRGVAAFLLGASFLASSEIASAQSTAGKPAEPSASHAPAPRIDINAASQTEIESLPGVGPSRARAIMELRTRMKGFRRVEDLIAQIK